MMSASDIRQAFLNYFTERGHQEVASSSLVPGNDPTLLFTNAGMVQFKEVFLGQEHRSYNRATSSQNCVRAGGKHNDLENVGYTARHHTYFEMLGNFSFGDYFKRQAIEYAWDFLTNVLGIPAEKLWVTVFKDDKEAEDIWLKDIKVSPERFSRCGEKDNFWQMGDTGPCGPCTEIFYDHGSSIPGGPPGSPDEDGDRYVEIWNLVFMQYNRDASGELTPLPKPSVDTGMGLERIAAVMQGVHDNYDIDIFRKLINQILAISNIKDERQISLRVIADHIRSTSFLIADGVVPSNEGRGYVLRRIIRRAIRHGNKLGVHELFFHKLVAALVDLMGEAYPNLKESQSRIEQTLKREEEQFAQTLDGGLKLLEAELKQISDQTIPGDVVFKLYDTYGFPTDLTADIARERNLEVDYAGFERCMAEQKQRSQASSRFKVDYNQSINVETETEFTGYESTRDSAKVSALFNLEGQPVTELTGEGIVVLDRTPFYAESGGQVGDTGKLVFQGGRFKVNDTQKQGLAYLHYGTVERGSLTVNTKVDAEVDSERQAIMLNHTATHLLHSALRRVVGDHVLQKGSLVAADRLRFDYAHHEPLTQKQLQDVEDLVNQQIRANLVGHVDRMTPQQAMEKGALALFDEKYGDEVRVLSIGEFSMELCGGTHVKYTGEIGVFKIISETGIASGIRRMEALTGEGALEWIRENEKLIDASAKLLKSNRHNLLEKLSQLQQSQKQLEKQVAELKRAQASSQSGDLASGAKDINGIRVLARKVDGVDSKTLRDMVDQLKHKLAPAAVILAIEESGKVKLVAGVTKDSIDKVHAGKLLNHVAQQINGKGGGRPDMAQGGGEDVSKLVEALDSVYDWIDKT